MGGVWQTTHNNMSTGPSMIYCGADGKVSPNRADLMQPFVRVMNCLKMNAAGDSWELLKQSWTKPKNDPSSLIYYSEHNKDSKLKHCGWKAMEPGRYLFMLEIEGGGTQVTGVVWKGPPVEIQFKEVMDPKKPMFHRGIVLLDSSKAPKWRRSVSSKGPICYVSLDIRVEHVRMANYVQLCFCTTPKHIHTSGATPTFQYSQLPIAAAAQVHPWQAYIGTLERMAEQPSMGKMLWAERQDTSDMDLVVKSDKTRFRVHRCVLAVVSPMLKLLLCASGGFRESTESKDIIEVRPIVEQMCCMVVFSNFSTQVEKGNGKAWALVVSCMYTGKLFELRPTANVREIIMALDCVEYYSMPEHMVDTIEDNIRLDMDTAMPIMVYAWSKHKPSRLMDKVVSFFEDSIKAMSMSTKDKELNWMAGFNMMKHQNKEIDKVFMRSDTIDWDAEVGHTWKKSLSDFYAIVPVLKKRSAEESSL